MAPMTMPSAPTPSNPIAQLWRATRTRLADLISEFLGPIEVARTLARKARAIIRRKLALLEALVLKLLLIEAAARAQEIPAQWPRFRRRAPTPKPASRRSENAAAPETWRVRFSLRLPAGPRTPHAPPRDIGGPRIRDLGRPLLVRDIWREQARCALIDRLHPKPDAAAAHARAQAKAMRLARRLEAVRRVIADPRRVIAALARKLASLGRAARAFARRIALAAPPRGGGPVFANAIVYACDASLNLPCDDTS